MGSTASTLDDAAFFPPLSSLLSGSSRLLSFQAVLNALNVAPTAADESRQLEDFCFDPAAFTLLASAPGALPAPDAKSKSDYDARTAPIQVSSSQNGDYDLEQMKEDALELSAQVHVAESLALRVVVLEWQSRAEAQLLSGQDEAGQSVELGASFLGRSFGGLSGSMNGAKTGLEFADKATRRQRQLLIFLRERSARLKLAVNLLGLQAVCDENIPSETWTQHLARQLFQDRLKGGAKIAALDSMFDQCMAALDAQMQVLDDTSKLPTAATVSEQTTLAFITATFDDIVCILRFFLVALHLRNDVLSSSRLLAWYRKMESVNYFLTLPPAPAWPDTTELQCLISLISFVVLQPDACISRMKANIAPDPNEASYPRLDGPVFFEDESCMGELSNILHRAALNEFSILSPAMLVLADITLPIRDVAKQQMDSRDLLLEDGSSDIEALGRRRSTRRESRTEMSAFEKVYLSLKVMEMEAEAREDPPAWFATVASQTVFAVATQVGTVVPVLYNKSSDAPIQEIARTQLLGLLSIGTRLMIYEAELLEAILVVLSPTNAGDLSSVSDITSRLCSNFRKEPTFQQRVVDQALARYPFELSPTLRLLSVLISARTALHKNIELLERLQTMTIMVPEHFNAYTLENEEENANEIRLEDDFPLFLSRQALSWYGPNHVHRKMLTAGNNGGDAGHEAKITTIPAGTVAAVLKESRPMVLKLEHAHSGFEYLALLLSTRLPNSKMCVEPSQPSLDRATAADIVALVNAFFAASLKYPRGGTLAQSIIDQMSEGLPTEVDITNVVVEFFESELIAHLDQTAQDGSLDLLIACAEYHALLLKFDAGRVWAALPQSSLLGLNGGTNALAAVVGALETATGSFRFLTACTSMFSNLVNDAVAGLVKRRPTKREPVKRGRFDSPIERSEFTPERSMQRGLSAYTVVMLEAWEGMSEWRFVDPDEKSSIGSKICAGFEMLLRATYGLQDLDDKIQGDADQASARLASVMAPAANSVMDFFAPKVENGSKHATSMRAFTTVFAGSAAVFQASPASPALVAEAKLVRASVSMLGSLLRTLRNKSDDARGAERAHGVASQLLRAMPSLVVIFTTEPSLKSPIATFLMEITVALRSAPSQADPPSLLGNLTPSSAKAFLQVLSQLDRPICDGITESAIWRFLAAVMRGRQQWLGMCLLTGAVPKDRLSMSTMEKPVADSKSLLIFAMNALSDIDDLAPQRSIALLDFVSAAQGASMWASGEVRRNTTFLDAILGVLAKMKDVNTKGNTKDQVFRARELWRAALACEVLAQAVHSSVEVGDYSVLKMLKGKLSFLAQHGHAVDCYNRSLHLNLRDNFRQKFEGLEIDAFRRSAANVAGDEGSLSSYFDLDVMDLALGHHYAWMDSTEKQNKPNYKSKEKSDRFRDEASRANVNFELLAAQKGLLRAWSVLATTLAESLGGVEEGVRAELSDSLAKAARCCLDANALASLDVPGMDQVVLARAEMSFVILSKLATGNASASAEIKAILPAAHRALRASPTDFDVAESEEDLQYYRLGLQILVLAVQTHISVATPRASSAGTNRATDETPLGFLDPAVAAVLAESVTATVAPAWRAIAGNLHTNIACALPADFALVVALLQAVLAVPGISAQHAAIAEAVAAWQLVRSALSLYSWADQLAAATGDEDPVYGELAAQFLHVLSTVRPVAEHIALEGALPTLAAANLSSYFRRNPDGAGPFDHPRRVFAIWAESLLPLCLNLLDAVGPPVAGEVGAFLNGFAPQLARANGVLENREPSKFAPYAGAITLGAVQQAHALCLIAMILESDAARAAAEGIDFAGDREAGVLRGYDHRKVVGEAQGLMRQKAGLVARIVAAGPVEEAWGRRMVDVVDSVLTRRVLEEVGEVAALGGDDGVGGEGS